MDKSLQENGLLTLGTFLNSRQFMSPTFISWKEELGSFSAIQLSGSLTEVDEGNVCRTTKLEIKTPVNFCLLPSFYIEQTCLNTTVWALYHQYDDTFRIF